MPVREIAERFAARFGKLADLRGQERPTAWLSNASLAHQLWEPPQVSEDQLIEWVASWILAGGETLQKPTHFEVRDGKF